MLALYILFGVLGVLLLLFAAWLVCLLSYKKSDEMKPFLGISIAHRGLHNDERPENSLAAFRAAKDAGLGMEFDLHLTTDGHLAVHHDDHTARMCGKKKVLCESTLAELHELSLPDGSKIPTFEEVLKIAKGEVPLLIELKTDKGNAAPLCAKTMEVLKDYSGPYLIESFDPRVLVCLKKTAPQVLRGQLSENFMGEKALSFPTRLLLTMMAANIAARPHFIAYNIAHRKALPLLLIKIAGAPVFFWTVRDKATLEKNKAAGDASIFEKFTL